MSILLKCKMAEYAGIYAGKQLWGLDCDAITLRQELFKLYLYDEIDNFSNTSCAIQLPSKLTQKIDRYKSILNKKLILNCRNCS